MEALLTAIIGIIKFFWDFFATFVYAVSEGLFPIVSLLFRPVWFIFEYVGASLPSFDELGSATSSITMVSTQAQDFLDSFLPEFVWPTIFAIFTAVLFISALHAFRKTT